MFDDKLAWALNVCVKHFALKACFEHLDDMITSFFMLTNFSTKKRELGVLVRVQIRV